MHNLIRFYNQNRKVIFRIILIIVLLVLGIQILNEITKKKYNVNNIKKNMQNTVITNNINKEIKSSKSAVTGQEVNKNKLKHDADIIKEFIDLCNSKDVENAYNYLSEDCKNKNFSNVNKFIEIYYNKIFNGEKKIYTITNWISNTYKIELSKNIMGTGKIEDSQTIQDYITIANDEENKININGYIGKTILSIESEKDNLNFKVVEQNQYMDYVEFVFEITNKSGKSVAIDLLDDINSMYVLDGSNVKHPAYTNELSNAQLIVDANTKRRVSIKYYSKYTSTRKLEEIVFSKVILNYHGQDVVTNNYSNIVIDL